MGLPPAPGSFSAWRNARTLEELAPRGETSGTFRHWRLGTPVRAYTAVQTTGFDMVGSVGGTGGVTGSLTSGGQNMSGALAINGVVQGNLTPGGPSMAATVGGTGGVTGAITVGANLTGLTQSDLIVWRNNRPIHIAKPLTEKSTGSMSFWRGPYLADVLQSGPPPTPPAEMFWRLGRPPMMARPK